MYIIPSGIPLAWPIFELLYGEPVFFRVSLFDFVASSDLACSYLFTGQLVSGSKDRTIRLWNLNTRRCVAVGKIPNSQAGGAGNRSRQTWLSLAWLPTGQVISSSTG